jgi:hypothetical protein
VKKVSLKEILVEPVQNASHYLAVCIYRLFNVQVESDNKILAALHEDLNAWEKLSDEALENFEKRFG